MTNIIEFKAPEEKPDPEWCTTIDGVEWFTFACQYEYEEKHWGLTIMALTWEEAEARLKGISSTGFVQGKLMGVVA